MSIDTTAAAASQTPSTNSSSTSLIGQQEIASNFQEFLQLLTTQLQNQDPLSPLDTNQFTQQLVEFAGVEQQLKTNSDLDQLITLNKTSQATAALNFVGAQVTADGSTTQLKNGVAVWNITSPKPAAASISILDQNGNTVWTGQQTLDTGAQSYSWNGSTSTGTTAPDGLYTIQITAQDASNQPVTISTQYSGTVTGVDLSGSQPLLQVGSSYLTISQVKSLQRSGS
ncbi:MAG TPA: flagellar hook capping FlgD N-terminal domain-containing protein [Xanthobacteraceae bacterium]|jgi:flagellar basal-body rod modification protein FlgD|nr:flagellar hook capping FlgD N-terminal domain-containing protein [Xanthobacteraceae bacterium]